MTRGTKVWLEIFVTALLLHVALILISIIEVFIYSMAFVTGRDQAFYSAHAEVSGPWVSGIFGFILIFLLVRRFIKKYSDHHLLYTIALPATYIIIDLLLLVAWGVDWSGLQPVMFLSNGVKLVAAGLSYWIFKPTV